MSFLWTWIFRQHSKNLIILLIIYECFNTGPFIWYISIHHVKHLDKLIKCLEMRPNIKSNWYIFFQLFPYKFNINVFWTNQNMEDKKHVRTFHMCFCTKEREDIPEEDDTWWHYSLCRHTDDPYSSLPHLSSQAIDGVY